jgi:hypothetical protein
MQGISMTSTITIGFEMTPALISFRRQVGATSQSLHALIVGLETLKEAEPVRPSDLIYLSWQKPATPEQWAEARTFALKGAMIVTIDALDHYLRVLSRIDGLVPDALHDKLNGRKVASDNHRPTLYERLVALNSVFPGARAEHLLAVKLLANWRNRFAHGDYKFALTAKECEAIGNTAAFFRANHGGADIQAALDRYIMSHPPTLLDLSTLIASAQRLIRDLDANILHRQVGADYAVALVRYLLENDSNPSVRLEWLFELGGDQAAGRLHALLLDHGGNHDKNRKANAPALTRQELNQRLGFGRNEASAFFNIPRP